MKYSIKALLALGVGLLVIGCGEGDKRALTQKTLYATGINPIEVTVSYILDGTTFVYEVDNHPSETVTLGCGLVTYPLNTSYGKKAKENLEALLPRGSKVTIFITGSGSREFKGLVLNEDGAFVNKEIVRTGTVFVDYGASKESVCEKEPEGIDYSPSQSIGDGQAEGYSKKDKLGWPFPWELSK